MNKKAFTAEDDVRRMKDETFQLRKQLVVLVEGRSDIHFWGRAFESVVGPQFKTYAFVNYPTTGASGKSTLITHYLRFADRELTICLDSDYDFLLGSTHFQQAYVFQTYVHSVENYLCYAPSLAGILAGVTQSDRSNFDFEVFFTRYSEAAFRWLACYLYARQNAHQEPEAAPFFKEIDDPEEDLNTLASIVNDEANEFYQNFETSPDFQDFLTALTQRGLRQNNTYLFLRGHDLFERFVVKLLECLAKPIIEFEMANRPPAIRNAYRSHLQRNSFERHLANNDGFGDCPFYQNILEDIRSAFHTTGA